MGEIITNILNLSESALNLLKKSNLVQEILYNNGKLIIDTDLHKLCEKTENFPLIGLWHESKHGYESKHE